jgi:hypothetical protein
LLVGALVGSATAFGVFFGLQVTDFDFFSFFSLCHFIFLFIWVVCSLFFVSRTEQGLMPGIDVLFWNQVV